AHRRTSRRDPTALHEPFARATTVRSARAARSDRSTTAPAGAAAAQSAYCAMQRFRSCCDWSDASTPPCRTDTGHPASSGNNPSSAPEESRCPKRLPPRNTLRADRPLRAAQL
nr:hypothetical protein [Tanacetum cinerariifolium]